MKTFLMGFLSAVSFLSAGISNAAVTTDQFSCEMTGTLNDGTQVFDTLVNLNVPREPQPQGTVPGFDATDGNGFAQTLVPPQGGLGGFVLFYRHLVSESVEKGGKPIAKQLLCFNTEAGIGGQEVRSSCNFTCTKTPFDPNCPWIDVPTDHDGVPVFDPSALTPVSVQLATGKIVLQCKFLKTL